MNILQIVLFTIFRLKVKNFLTNVLTIGQDFLRTFCKFFYLRFFVSSDHRKNVVQRRFYWLFKRHFYMKAFMPLWSFRKKQGSKKFRGLVTRNIFFCLSRVALYFKDRLNSIEFYKTRVQ